MVDGTWVTEALISADGTGRFQRAETTLRNWITADGAAGPSGTGGYAAESGRYHLYVAAACPWAHRTLIFRALKGLVPHISVDIVHPDMLDDGWTFATDADLATGDTLHGAAYLREVYARAVPDFSGRVTVPILWDKATDTIVSNESAEIIRMFNSAFDGVTGDTQDFCPSDLREEIEAVNTRLYRSLNNGVYRAGFAQSQAAYDEASAEIFATLKWMEDRLGRQRYLAGDRVTEADWRAAPTLFRFDAVYHTHFKATEARIIDYPNLWAYARELYQWPGIAETFHLATTMRHYYASHLSINPKGIVPRAPDIDWSLPHGRG